MFFRRSLPHTPTFSERLDSLRTAGFLVAPAAGGLRVSREPCAAVLAEAEGSVRVVESAGILMGEEIAHLVDGGFQKYFRTVSGRGKPALSGDLEAIHAFEEDLKESLGLESLYNESLGTVSPYSIYDRLEGREG